ncbi:cholecystokinin receptor type A-like isoform X2 [Portunus trituberculatus]|uniref:cholecystokinin receptor type A-like isoform X2 n=1 Tax=Portunus trituberculatus TaxID=210409 RepID=UPI001E1CE1C7|nr:cholecystokinin receptor type A-like isoform X2 [Portunus trituberculatus]
MDAYSEGSWGAAIPLNLTLNTTTPFDLHPAPRNDSLSLVIDDPNDMNYPWKFIPFFYLHITIYCVTLLLGVVGNVAVIILMAGDRKSRSTTNMFLVSLSVADLLMLLLCVPLKTVYFFVVLWDSGGAACKVANYVMMLSFTASVLNLTAVSLERFIVIVFPMRSRSLCTMSNCRRSVIVVWVTSLLLASPVISIMRVDTVDFTDRENTVLITAYYCKEKDSIAFLTYQLLVLFVIPALLMIIFYASVSRELWRSTKTIKALTNYSMGRGSDTYYLRVTGGEELNFRTSRRYGRSTTPTTTTSTTTTTTSNGRMRRTEGRSGVGYLYVPVSHHRSRTPSPGILRHKGKEKGEDVKKARKQVFYNFNIVFVLLPFIHCCINPIIYCSMSKNFRRSMKKAVPCRSSCCEPRPAPANLLNRVVTKSVYSSCSPEGTRHTDFETMSSI